MSEGCLICLLWKLAPLLHFLLYCACQQKGFHLWGQDWLMLTSLNLKQMQKYGIKRMTDDGMKSR